jgi:ParB family transcriptional regulator, chromosome partitioning protein
MKIINLPLDQLQAAPWNSNTMAPEMLAKLKESVKRYGLLENLVVRKIPDGSFETLSGNQRLKILREMGFSQAPCVVVEMDDAHARLLAQALNHLRGEDDPWLLAQLMQKISQSMSQEEVLAILPQAAVNLPALANIKQSDMAAFLQNWDQGRAGKLRNMQFRLTGQQQEKVNQALALFMPKAKQNPGNNPNSRGTALFLLCQNYLERKNNDGKQ